MTATVAAVTVRELVRRGWALVMVVLLPLFLLHMGPVRLREFCLVVGAGWATATLALFSCVAARPVERRLWVVGASGAALHFGRQLALSGTGLGVAVVAWVADRLDGAPAASDTVALALGCAVLVGVPLGALVAQVVPREMDGTLVMIAVLAITLTVRDGWARFLPFWSANEFLGALSPYGASPQTAAGLFQAGAAFAVLTLAAWWAHRLRLARG